MREGEGYERVTLASARGEVECRLYASANGRAAVMWVGGIGGGFDTPARGLYPRLAGELARAGIASLRVRFRHPTLLDEAVFDVVAGARYLETEDVEALALVGHSFGGAVVVQAGALLTSVRTVVTLATQSYGTDPVRDLAPRSSLLLVHGEADVVLPPFSSVNVHARARGRKRLVLYEGAGHGLDEVAEEVEGLVREWILAELGIGGEGGKEEKVAEDLSGETEDLPLEPGGGDEREGRRIDQGSATGEAGISGTHATDFRPGRAEETPLDEGEEEPPE